MAEARPQVPSPEGSAWLCAGNIPMALEEDGAGSGFTSPV